MTETNMVIISLWNIVMKISNIYGSKCDIFSSKQCHYIIGIENGSFLMYFLKFHLAHNWWILTVSQGHALLNPPPHPKICQRLTAQIEVFFLLLVHTWPRWWPFWLRYVRWVVGTQAKLTQHPPGAWHKITMSFLSVLGYSHKYSWLGSGFISQHALWYRYSI